MCFVYLCLPLLGPLLWNCLPAQINAPVLSGYSSSAHLLKAFLFPGVHRTLQGASDYSLQ